MLMTEDILEKIVGQWYENAKVLQRVRKAQKNSTVPLVNSNIEQFVFFVLIFVSFLL